MTTVRCCVDVVSADVGAIDIIPELLLLEGKPQVLSVTVNASKEELRTSLKASTLDGVFASVFSNVTSGVLLTHFFLELGATSTQIGILASIPMLSNLLQPIGAYLSERTQSRHYYCLWIYGISRTFWIGLAIAIFWFAHDAPVGWRRWCPEDCADDTSGSAIALLI
jgi:hypothetical protein